MYTQKNDSFNPIAFIYFDREGREREGGGGGERDRQTDRQTETDRQTDREREREDKITSLFPREIDKQRHALFYI